MSNVPIRRQIVDTRHGQMHVKTAGEGGTPLLLSPSQVMAHWFDMAIPLLATDRMVVVPDRIGHGLSDPATKRLTFFDYADSTFDALDALGIAEFDAIGIHS